MRELLRFKEEVTKERDQLLSEVVRLRENVTNMTDQQTEAEKTKVEADSTIAQVCATTWVAVIIVFVREVLHLCSSPVLTAPLLFHFPNLFQAAQQEVISDRASPRLSSLPLISDGSHSERLACHLWVLSCLPNLLTEPEW